MITTTCMLIFYVFHKISRSCLCPVSSKVHSTSIPSPRLMASLFLTSNLHDPYSSALRKKKIVLLRGLSVPFVKCTTTFPFFTTQTSYLLGVLLIYYIKIFIVLIILSRIFCSHSRIQYFSYTGFDISLQI